LGQANLTLELLSLCLGGDRHATSEDNIDLPHLLISVRICPTLIDSPGLLQRQCYWWWHLLPIQKICALFQIVPHGAVNLTTLLRIVETLKRSLLLLLRGRLAVISVISSVLVIASVCVNLAVILLP
jgi:hypothetical protein